MVFKLIIRKIKHIFFDQNRDLYFTALNKHSTINKQCFTNNFTVLLLFHNILFFEQNMVLKNFILKTWLTKEHFYYRIIHHSRTIEFA